MENFNKRIAYQDIAQHIKKYREVMNLLPDHVKENWHNNFTIDFTHNTTAIEGNTLTLIDTKMILEDGIIPKETTLWELDQIRGHADAWSYVKKSVMEKVPLTEEIVKDIHERVLPTRGVGGIYRDYPVYIKGAQHVPPNYKRVREDMAYFAHNIKNCQFSDPLEKAAWVHAEFVRIHPFGDGNGRTARLLMNYVLLENNCAAVNIKKDNVKEYFDSLEEFSLNGKLDDFKDLLIRNELKSITDFLEVYQEYAEELAQKKNGQQLTENESKPVESERDSEAGGR